MKEKSGKKKKLVLVAAIVTGLLILVYAAGVIYFTGHFYTGVQIDGQPAGGKNVAAAEEMLQEKAADYELVITDKDGGTETLRGVDIVLEYKDAGELKKALKKQNAFLWPASFFGVGVSDIEAEMSLDSEKLSQKLQSLKVMTQEQTPAQSASPKFNGEKFVVEPEVYGTAIDAEVLQKKAEEAVKKMKPELPLAEEGCYVVPKYTSESKEVEQACDEMNEYCKASVTYTMDKDVVVDAAVISTWLTVDDDMKVVLQEDAIKTWLAQFGDQYDTVGTERTFTTPTGKTATVSGGTYGWSIDEEAELAVLLDAVKNQKTLTKEPEYYVGGTAASHGTPDWGTTYAEVDLTAQHLWYVVDGAVVLESDVITGVPGGSRETPQGVNIVWEKEIGKTLVGEILPSTGKPEYETPVTYWMRITWEGIGFHDATWQWSFGGTAYQDPNIGSHGCINMPYDKAEALYNMIEVGTPVIIHY